MPAEALTVGPQCPRPYTTGSLFNISGILLIYPVKAVRNIPIRLAQGLAARTAERRIYALLYMIGVFFILPLLFVLIDKLVRGD